jgi:hypothetical protein
MRRKPIHKHQSNRTAKQNRKGVRAYPAVAASAEFTYNPQLNGQSNELILPSFATLVNTKVVIPSSRSDYLAVDKHFLQSSLLPLIEKIPLDDAWYLEWYPDVREAIRNRIIASAREHYVRHGYYENRLPYQINVDETWYLNQYTDVREALKQEQYPSGRGHFYTVGFGEGRLPYEGFVLQVAR